MKINKSRIINLNYNDGKRTIYNETFNFRGGKDTLFSMDNGVGKTVIIQFLLQPFLKRNRDLAKRDIRSYFKGTNPVYIFHELIFDNRPEKLLIGVMMKGDKSGEDKNRIKIYGVTHLYKNENAFDIDNLPFVRNENGKNKIITFAEAETMLRQESKNNFNLNIYNFDDNSQKRKYFNYLSKNGIDIKEWETLIKKINQTESGLSELFSNCETTPELLKKQIIPIIDEKLNANENRIESIIQHTKKYINTYLDHQQEIQKANAYKGFLNDVTEVDSIFSEYSNIHESLSETGEFLNKIYLSVVNQLENKSEDSSFISKLAQKEKELKEVDVQELSYEYHNINSQLKEFEEEEHEIKYSIDLINENISDYQQKMSIQECAKHYARLTKKQSALFALKETLSNYQLNDQEIIDAINNYSCTLANAYKKQIESLDVDIVKIDETIANLTKNKDAAKSLTEKLQEDISKNIELRTEADLFIKRYLEKESSVCMKDSKLKEILDMNSNSPKQDILNKYLNDLIDEKSDRMKIKHQQMNELEMLKNDIIEISNNVDELKKKNVELSNELYKAEFNMSEITKTKDRLLNILQKYDVTEITAISLQEIKHKLIQELNKYEDLKESVLRECFYYEHIYDNLIKNQLVDIDVNILNLLDEHNISYHLGSDWIKNNSDFNEMEKHQIIQNNPLLPYSLIIAKEDFNDFLKIDFNSIEIGFVPIFTSDEATMTFEPTESKFISSTNEMKILSKFNVEMIGADYYDKYVASVKLKLDKIQKKLQIINKESEIIQRDANELNLISYDEGLETKLQLSLITLRDKLKDNNNSLDIATNDLNDMSASADSLNKSIINLDEIINNLSIQKDRGSELLNISEEFDESLVQTELLNKKIESKRNEIKVFENSIKNYESDIHLNNVKRLEALNKKNLAASGLEKVKDVKGSLINEELSIEELTQTIESMESKLSKGVSSLKKDIENLNDDIVYISGDIDKIRAKYNLSEDDYKDVDYSQDILDHYEELIYDKESEKEDLSETLSNLNKDVAVYQSKLEDKNEELNEIGITSAIPYEKITIRGFDRIRSQIEDEIKQLQESNKENMVLYEKFSLTISKMKKFVKTTTLNREDSLILNIEDLKDSIDLVDDYLIKYDECKEKMNHLEKQIRYKLNEYSRTYKEVEEQICNILIDDDILGVNEKLNLFKSSLADLLNYLELTTANVYQEEMFVINESISHAWSLYSEIIQIDKKSKIFINGRNKQMLQIKVPAENELNKNAVENYIREIIYNIIENQNELDINKTLLTQIKSINLFEKLVNGFNNIKVNIYKIEKHSLIKKEWKEINSENSGGEQFVSVFILFISLLAYMRENSESDNESKVLIMDNPFAKTNAEHLLVPMFDIAKKFNTQLICFSGIGGSSVYNRFDVIYATKIIKDKYRNNEILDFTDNSQNPESVELTMIVKNFKEVKKSSRII